MSEELKSEKLKVIKFGAKWCGPCKKIDPYFNELSNEYKNVIFTHVDVDEDQDVAEDYEISALPTFVFEKGDEEVSRFEGSDKEGLKAVLDEFLKEVEVEKLVEEVDKVSVNDEESDEGVPL